MSIEKKDLLDDIQKRIDTCDEKISQNPYQPAQRRVQYILNNSCRTLDIPFYLIAIYREQQRRLNTDLEQRRKMLYKVTKEFSLANIQNMSIDVELMETIVTQRQKFVAAHKETRTKYQELGETRHGRYRFKEKKYTYTVPDQWVDVVNNEKERFNSTYAEQVKNKHFNSLGEAVQFYKTIKKQIGKEEKIENDAPNKEGLVQFRTISTYTFKAHAYFNFDEYINKLIEDTRKEEQGTKGTEGQELLNWKYYDYIFKKKDSNKEIKSVSDEDRKVQITEDLQKLIKKKVNTNVYDPILEKLQKEYNQLANLCDSDFQKDYFQPYENVFDNYKALYAKTKDKTSGRLKIDYRRVISKLDNCFDIITERENQITLPALQDLIKRYKTLEDLNDIYEDERPVLKKEVKKLADLEETDSYKMLLSRQKEMQQVLNTGNAKLREYYQSQINKYTQQTEQYKKKLEQNKKDIEDYKKYLKEYEKDMQAWQNSHTYLYNPDNVDFPNLLGVFRTQLKTWMDELQKKLDTQTAIYNAEVAKKLQEYEESTDYFQASEIKFELIISFMPDGIPYYCTYETLASSFVKEDLDKQLKKIIEEQNNQKRKELSKIKSGDTYQKSVQELAEVEEEINDQKLYLSQLSTEFDKCQQYLVQLYKQQEVLLYYPDAGSYTQSVDFNNQVNALKERISSLTTEINGTKQYIEYLNSEYATVGYRVAQLEGYIQQPSVQQVSPKYQVYEDKKEIENQLKILNGQLIQIDNIKKNQIALNQAIIATNQDYVLTRNKCLVYYDYLDHIQELRRQGGKEEEIEQYQTMARDWWDHNHQRLDQLEQYSQDLQQQKEDYLNNSNFLASTQDFNTRKNALEQQLADIDAKISALESPSIVTNIAVNEDGVAYETGYDFSGNNLYKNIYIDVQEKNEWLDLKKEIEALRNNYDFYLPSQIEQPKKEIKKVLPKVSVDDVVQLFNDDNSEGKCSWFIPMDYEIFDIPIPSWMPFIPLTVKVQKRDKHGQRIPLKDKEGEIIPGKWETEDREMAVQNGYGFIYTGQKITLSYTGIPCSPPEVSVFISGVGLDYGTLLAGNYVATTPLNIYLLKKFPYQNPETSGIFFWMQTGAVGDIAQTVVGKYPIEVTFKIYKKFPLVCGFPKKCGLMSNEEFEIRGRCGLRQFFDNTHDISTDFKEDSFDPTKFFSMIEFDEDALSKENSIKKTLGPIVQKTTGNMLNDLSNTIKSVDSVAQKAYDVYRRNFGEVGDRAAKFMQNKRKIAEWGNASYTIATNTWNIGDAMSNINITQNSAKKLSQSIIDRMKGQLLDLIPPECQDTICNTWREAKQDSIKELGGTVNESTNTSLETLNNFVNKSVSDTCEALADKATKIAAGVWAPIKLAGQSIGNFFNQFEFRSLTQYCPRRLSDVTKDINPLKGQPKQLPDGTWEIPDSPDIFTQLSLTISQQMIGSVMEALNNCVTRSVTNHNINYSNLFPDGTRKYLEAANSVGDIANMAKEINGSKMTLDNLFHEGNRSSILSNFMDIDTGNISLGYLTDELYERGIDNFIDIDATLNKDQVISSLKNTISKAVSNNNDIMDKLDKGEILSMNDQFKQLADKNRAKKTEQWAKNISDKVNTTTTIGQKAKSIVNTDLSQVWQDPFKTVNKLQSITKTMSDVLMKEALKRKHQQEELDAAYSTSQQFKEVKTYGLNRYKYLEELVPGVKFDQRKDILNKM